MFTYDDKDGNVIVNTGRNVGCSETSLFAMHFTTKKDAETAIEEISKMEMGMPDKFTTRRKYWIFGSYVVVNQRGFYLMDYETGRDIYNEATGLNTDQSKEMAVENYHSAQRNKLLKAINR